MSKLWTGITAGLLAGAAGATAKNVVSFIDQIAADDAPPSSPAGGTVARTADSAATVATQTEIGGTRSSALGALGGLGIGVAVGAVAGAVRGANATPNPVLAAALTGGAAFAAGDGLAAVTGQPKAHDGVGLARDAVAHAVYGAVTAWALHRLLDPRTPVVARINPLSR